jgi:hypothetical protein
MHNIQISLQRRQYLSEKDARERKGKITRTPKLIHLQNHTRKYHQSVQNEERTTFSQIDDEPIFHMTRSR